jgi:hypothetical protein
VEKHVVLSDFTANFNNYADPSPSPHLTISEKNLHLHAAVLKCLLLRDRFLQQSMDWRGECVCLEETVSVQQNREGVWVLFIDISIISNTIK